MKIKQVDTRKQSLKFKAENNRDIKWLLSALTAKKLHADNWRGWIDVNGAKVRYNPETKTVFYAAKKEDNTNKYLFDHLAASLAKYCNVPTDQVDIDNTFGKQLDIYQGGQSKYYCAKFKLDDNQLRHISSQYHQTPEHFRKIIKAITAKLEDDGKDNT